MIGGGARGTVTTPAPQLPDSNECLRSYSHPSLPYHVTLYPDSALLVMSAPAVTITQILFDLETGIERDVSTLLGPRTIETEILASEVAAVICKAFGRDKVIVIMGKTVVVEEGDHEKIMKTLEKVKGWIDGLEITKRLEAL